MFYQDFQDFFFKYFLIILLEGLGILIVYIPFMKKKQFNVFSPVFNPFYTGIATVVIFSFLLTMGLIDKKYAFSFYFSEIMFLFGFSIDLKNRKKSECSFNFTSVDYLYYLFMASVFFLSTVIIYIFRGIPLFMDSRFEASLGGGGFGIFTRFTSFFGAIVLFYSLLLILHNKAKKRYKNVAKYILFLYCVTLFLSGSKAAFYSVLLNLYIVCKIYNDEQPELNGLLTRKIKKYFPLLLLSIVVMFFFRYGANVFKGLIFRLICQGDSVFLTYANSNIEKLARYNLFDFLFNNILVTFRLMPPSESVVPAGMEIIEIVYGHMNAGGSVTPHNIDGYLLFGNFSFIFSFFVGILLNISINGIYKKRRSILITSIILSICLSLNCVSYNFIVAISNVTSVLLCIPLCIFAYYSIMYLTPESYKIQKRR